VKGLARVDVLRILNSRVRESGFLGAVAWATSIRSTPSIIPARIRLEASEGARKAAILVRARLAFASEAAADAADGRSTARAWQSAAGRAGKGHDEA
jgi:hypothetical protein